MTTDHNWTDDDIKKITDMLIAGYSYREISFEIFGTGEKRNAIAGVVHRNKLTHLNDNSYNSRKRKPKASKPKPPKKINVGWHEAQRVSAMKKSPPVAPELLDSATDMLTNVVLDAEKYPRAVSFADIRDGLCRWPVQDHPPMFCGEASGRRPYCPVHRQNGRVEPRGPRSGAKKLWKTW
jgi:hypothetical protein